MSEMHVKLIRIKADMIKELESATDKHGNFPTGFHGYAVIKEELEELWEAIKSKDATLDDVRYEAIQIGAMAMRFILDLCDDAG